LSSISTNFCGKKYLIGKTAGTTTARAVKQDIPAKRLEWTQPYF